MHLLRIHGRARAGRPAADRTLVQALRDAAHNATADDGAHWHILVVELLVAGFHHPRAPAGTCPVVRRVQPAQRCNMLTGALLKDWIDAICAFLH